MRDGISYPKHIQSSVETRIGIGKAEIPDWLVQRFVEGTVDIGALTIGETTLDGVRSRVRWDGPRGKKVSPR